MCFKIFPNFGDQGVLTLDLARQVTEIKCTGKPSPKPIHLRALGKFKTEVRVGKFRKKETRRSSQQCHITLK